MLKRTIEYKDFDGVPQAEVHYFNISNSELIEMESTNVQAMLKKIVEDQDKEGLIREMKRFILMSYGIKSEDGKRFMKSTSISDDFAQTAAYDALFLELCTDEDAAVDFIKGILPQEIMDKAAAMQPQDKPVGPPPVPKHR